MTRILKGVASTITVSIYDAGVLIDPTGNAVTIVLTNLAGTEVVASTSAARVSVGLYSFVITPTIATTLDTLTATWTFTLSGNVHAVTEDYESEGAQLFTISEARGFGDTGLADATKYPNATIAGARDRIAEEFERICGTSFTPRSRFVVIDGSKQSRDGASVWLPSIRTASVSTVETREHGTQTWTAFTADEVADVLVTGTGRIERESLADWPPGTRNIRVQYSYGYDEPPTPIKRAALVLIRAHAVPSDIDTRAMSLTDELGTYRFAAAGERGAWFGIPDVDAVLDRYGAGGPGRML